MITRNNRTVTLKVARHEVIDLMLICNTIAYQLQQTDPVSMRKWNKLHDKINDQLKQYDKKHEEDLQ